MEGMIKKILAILVLVIIVLAIIFFISPKFKQGALNFSQKAVKGVSFTADKIKSSSRAVYQRAREVTSRIASRVQTSRTQRGNRNPNNKSLVNNNCTYKEFSDLNLNTSNYGWSYWYMHSAKQNGILSYDDSTCQSGSISAFPGVDTLLGDICQLTNRALGISTFCPTGDGDNYPFWVDKLNLGETISRMLGQGAAITNSAPPTTGSTAPSWSLTGCDCQTNDASHSGWSCLDCQQNSDSGGSCQVHAPTYTPGCVNKAQTVSLLTYNLNKYLQFKLLGNLTVANSSRPDSELIGSRLELYEINSSGARVGGAIASATADGDPPSYTFDFSLPITQFYEQYAGKRFELSVIPSSDEYYPDSRFFSFNAIVTNLNFPLLLKEDFGEQTFADISPDHWAYWYITSLVQNRVMGGYDGMFYPDFWVTRAGAALYSTLAKGAQPCCGAAGDPGTGTGCQTCTGQDYYYDDLTPQNYFWGYAQSALRAGTMTGYDDNTFRPTENIIQAQTWLTMLKGGVSQPQVPAGYTPPYTPGFSDSAPTTRAQMAALYAWNFPQTLPITLQGYLTVKDNARPADDLLSANPDISILRQDGGSETNLSGDADIALGPDTDTRIKYTIAFNKTVPWTVTNVTNKTFNIKFQFDGFTDGQTDNFTIDTVDQPDRNIEVETDYNSVKISGEIGFKATGCTESTEIFQNAQVVAFAIDPKAADVYYDPNDHKVKYNVTIIREHPDQEEIFSLTTSLDNFRWSNESLTLSPRILNFSHNIGLVPEEIEITGRFIDAKTGEGIADMDFSNGGPSNEQGFFNFSWPRELFGDDLPVLVTILSIGHRNLKGYPIIFNYQFPAKGCPTETITIKLDKQPECQTLNNVDFCWYGDKAKQWHNDPFYNSNWIEIADVVNQLRTKTSTQLPKRINITAGSNANAVGAPNGRILPGESDPGEVPYFETIQLGVGLMERVSFYCIHHTVSHEFGHLYLFYSLYDSQQVFWKSKFDTAISFEDVHFNRPSHEDSFWWQVTDQTYDDGCAGGHPWDNEGELFASTFSITDFAQTRFKQAAQNAPNPDQNGHDIRTWMTDIYNKHANTWAGDPIAFIRKILISTRSLYE